jgi:hypothetical protein
MCSAVFRVLELPFYLRCANAPIFGARFCNCKCLVSVGGWWLLHVVVFLPTRAGQQGQGVECCLHLQLPFATGVEAGRGAWASQSGIVAPRLTSACVAFKLWCLLVCVGAPVDISP